jgi:chromosome segregation ATPase
MTNTDKKPTAEETEVQYLRRRIDLLALHVQQLEYDVLSTQEQHQFILDALSQVTKTIQDFTGQLLNARRDLKAAQKGKNIRALPTPQQKEP